MKAEQYDLLVKLMRGSPDAAANRAARRVLVDGITQADAMRETGASRAGVSHAVGRYTDAYDRIQEVFSFKNS